MQETVGTSVKWWVHCCCKVTW